MGNPRTAAGRTPAPAGLTIVLGACDDEAVTHAGDNERSEALSRAATMLTTLG